MRAAEPQPDYYGILGVPRHATEEGIRRAYIRKAWRHHPDIHTGDPDPSADMRDVNAAYETLSDPVLRTRYDSLQTSIRLRHRKSTPPARYSSGKLRVPVRRGKRRPGVLHTVGLLIRRLARYVSG
ncbi:MAG: J domain-containing protein [Dehalococcoidia bacterium]|nr:J domain-containing protein [Dehalococcoidia bacterium]